MTDTTNAPEKSLEEAANEVIDTVSALNAAIPALTTAMSRADPDHELTEAEGQAIATATGEGSSCLLLGSAALLATLLPDEYGDQLKVVLDEANKSGQWATAIKLADLSAQMTRRIREDQQKRKRQVH